MRRKGLIILATAVMSLQLMGASAQEVLRKAREDYYKQQAAAAKAEKERAAAEARAQKEVTKGQKETVKVTPVGTTEVTEEGIGSVKVGEDGYPTLERVKEPKPKNEMERLERTAAKATDRVDFYERVVRSVAREETELKEYNEILGKKKTKYNKVPKVTGLGK